MRYLLSRVFINPITTVLCLEFLTSQTNRLGKIYIRTKYKKIKDSAFAEFNYNVLNNLICNNYIVSKWKNDVTMYCSICNNVIENNEHMIFNCKNVRRIWEIVGITLKFAI